MSAEEWRYTPRYVYTFWSESGECLYVGCTDNLARRLTAHQKQRPWWPEVARVDVQRYADYSAGLAAEEARIRELNPTHNRVFTDHDTPRQPLSPEAAARKSLNLQLSFARRRRQAARS